METPRLISGKWILLIFSALILSCVIGLVLWTRSTPVVRNAAEQLHHPVPGIM